MKIKEVSSYRNSRKKNGDISNRNDELIAENHKCDFVRIKVGPGQRKNAEKLITINQIHMYTQSGFRCSVSCDLTN